MCKRGENKMSANPMIKTTFNPQNEHILKALKEVELIQAGKLPRKTARDFLKEVRNR